MKNNLLKNSNPRLLYTLVAFFSFLLLIGSIVYTYFSITAIEQKSSNLSNIGNYSFSSLSSNDNLKMQYPLRKSLGDVVDYQEWTQEEIQKGTKQRQKLSIPYENFLHLLYTPSLNIWKDTFGSEIDTSLVGEKYLLNNPYDDIKLIQKRTDFFKDMGVVDQYNTISDISLGDTTTTENGLFYLPVTVQFETPDRRSFLLLVNKLSMTSYVENVSLINEYMFYLRDAIKEFKTQELDEQLESDTLPSLVTTQDQLIGYLMYQWINQDADISLIDQEVLNSAISKSAWCTDQSPQECLYMFREKYRSVPYLAYAIAREGIDPVQGLKQFFLTMPPLISIDSFSFDAKEQQGRKARDYGYEGYVSIKVYGKDLFPDEVNEIARRLGEMCFQDKTTISAWYANIVLNRQIEQLGQQDAINAKRSSQLNEMQEYISKIEEEYDTLSNYKKVVRLFEIYRTLQEGNSCDLIQEDENFGDEITGNSDFSDALPGGVMDSFGIR